MNGREFGRGERVYFLDSLRFWLVVIVVAFHGALSQTTFIPTWVISDPHCSSIWRASRTACI